jgi:hypothetical protein
MSAGARFRKSYKSEERNSEAVMVYIVSEKVFQQLKNDPEFREVDLSDRFVVAKPAEIRGKEFTGVWIDECGEYPELTKIVLKAEGK